MANFGRERLGDWFLDPEVAYLNHGTVGAPPRKVLAVQQSIREETERAPSRFMQREISPMMGGKTGQDRRIRQAADTMARFVGAQARDFVFVDNATSGVNAVLASMDWRPNDQILMTDHTYGGVANALRYHARRNSVELKVVDLPFPCANPNDITRAIGQNLCDRTRLLLIDHVTSETAMVLPVRAIAEACRTVGAKVLVDGAHGPGAIPVDIPALGVDWYAGNFHKWAFAPRACGFLWASRERQPYLHPTVISWGLDMGFVEEFDWTGTRDTSAFLAAPAGLEFMQADGIEAVQGYNNGLVRNAASLLAEHWQVPLELNPQMTGTMATVPLPSGAGSTGEEAQELRKWLLLERNIEAPVLERDGRLWVRICAQIYNDIGDYERLADAVIERMSKHRVHSG